jgi:hypothetical protein
MVKASSARRENRRNFGFPFCALWLVGSTSAREVAQYFLLVALRFADAVPPVNAVND